MRILLIRLRLIGDVVFTTPAIGAIKRRFPDAHLTYLVEPAAAPVVAWMNDSGIEDPVLRKLRASVTP